MRTEEVETPTSGNRLVGRSLRRTPCRVSDHLSNCFRKGVRSVGLTTLRLTKMGRKETLHDFDHINIYMKVPADLTARGQKNVHSLKICILATDAGLFKATTRVFAAR